MKFYLHINLTIRLCNACIPSRLLLRKESKAQLASFKIICRYRGVVSYFTPNNLKIERNTYCIILNNLYLAIWLPQPCGTKL